MKKWILLVGVTLCLAGCEGQLNQITSESYSTINHEELAINIDDNEQIDRLNQKMASSKPERFRWSLIY